MRIVASLVAAAACALFAFAAYDGFAKDRDARKPVEAFAQRFQMTLRRPAVAATLQYAPSADFATDLVADASLRDATVSVRLAGLTPEQRMAWLDAIGHIDEQLARAADLSLDAMTQRPGWPYHPALLGQLVYTRDARALSPSIVTQSNRWTVPLGVATTAASNDDLLWQFTALAYLQTWPDLGSQHRNATPVFRRAFEDVDFVRATFASAVQIIGIDAAVNNLPDAPKPLWAAFNQLANAGDMDHAWRVHQRWDAAEWNRRAADLAAIEQAASRRDVGIVRAKCESWTRDHSVWDYDTPAAHAQAARLLELWPVSDSGKWSNDERADVIRYFLSGRREGASGALLVRTAETVSGVPEPTQAQLHVLASDLGGAEAIAKRSDSFGSFEWKPYLFELSRYWMNKGDRTQAQAALAKLPATAREECEAVTLTGGTTQLANTIRFTLNDRVSVPMCNLQPAAAKLTLSSDTPAVLDYGWDGARNASVLLQSGIATDVTLPPATGQRTITLRALAQKPTVSVTVTPLS